MLSQPCTSLLGSPVVPFCPFPFGVPLLKPNSRTVGRRVPLLLTGEPRFLHDEGDRRYTTHCGILSEDSESQVSSIRTCTLGTHSVSSLSSTSGLRQLLHARLLARLRLISETGSVRPTLTPPPKRDDASVHWRRLFNLWAVIGSLFAWPGLAASVAIWSWAELANGL